jgi:hypothetical protein
MNIGKAFKNTAKAITKPLIGLAMLAAPLLSQGQKNTQKKDKKDNRYAVFSAGAAFTSSDLKPKFDFHGMTNLIGNVVHVKAGARITGEKYGGSYSFSSGSYRRYTEFARQFTTAYYGVMVAPKINLGDNMFIMAGGQAQANHFPGGRNNRFEFSDFQFGATGQFYAGIPLDNGHNKQNRKASSLGLKGSVDVNLVTLENKSIYRRFASNFATNKQVNPDVIVNLGLAWNF